MPTPSEIRNLPQGAIWLKADLHVHTSASRDISPSCVEHTADDVIRIALEKGLEIIAVTDHNTAANCDAIQKASQGTAVTVFLGVEITTPQGHVLAIFETGTPASKIEDLLIKLGIPRDKFSSLDIATERSIYDVFNHIETANTVAIAAHVENERGFLKMIDVAAECQKAYAAPGLKGLDIVNPSLREKYQTGHTRGYSRRSACVQSSDCPGIDDTRHNINNMGSRYILLKMGERSLSGLKLSLIDPEMRIRFQTDANPIPKDIILGMWVSGGFLDRQEFRFNNNVTCLIGDTGSGKSVCLELLRFGLNQTAHVPKIKQEVDSLLREQLGNLGTVHILIKKDDSYYLVERAWGATPTLPTVSRILNGNIDRIEEDIEMELFFPIKAFSQSEIIEFAREPAVRLSLTDDLIDYTTDASKISEIKLLLQQNALNIQEKLRKKTVIQKKLTDLPTLIESRRQIDTLLDDERIKLHHLWYKEKAILDKATAEFSSLDGSIPICFSSIHFDDPAVEDLDTLPNADLVRELLLLYSEWHSVLTAVRDSMTTSLKNLMEKITVIRGHWDTKFIAAKTAYQKFFEEIDKDGKGLQVLSERRRRLQDQITSLQHLERELNTDIIPQIQSLHTGRETLLTDLQENRRAITSKREIKATELSEKLENRIRLDVHSQANRDLFRSRLQQIAQGSGFRSDDLDTLMSKCHPIAFVKHLLNENYDHLVEQSTVDKTWLVKYRDNVFEKNRLDEFYELQIIDLEDIIEVKLKIGPTEYKPIEALAHGQKCMVVLMVALAEGQSPLIVDQPEDALHAPGIEEGIVTTLRSRRGIRQSIFTTRNANIIVSADSEQILPLSADARNGKLVGCGCLDSYDQKKLVIYHVEGGDEAFQRRQTKYTLRPN